MILDERSCRRSKLNSCCNYLIGVIVAVVTPLINSLMSNTANRACCTDAGGIWKSGKCTSGGNNQYDSAGYNECVNSAKNNS